VRAFALLGLACALLGNWGCQADWMPRGERPGWVDEPAAPEGQGRFLSAVAAAEPGADPEIATAQAELGARDGLRQAISDYTRSAVAGFLAANRQYPPASSPLCAELADILRTEVPANILRLAMRNETWLAPDGRVYVLYRVPLAVVNAEVSQRAREALLYVNPFGAEAEQAVVELDGYLEALLSERLKAATRTRPRSEETPPDEQTPAWLESGRHEDYPADRFHSAIGWGRDLPAAEASARAELSFRLSAQTDRLLAKLPNMAAAAPLTASLQWLEPNALGFTDDDLAIVRIAERWYDPVMSIHYALGVLNPSTAVLILRRRITEARDQADGLLASARNHQRAENYAASLREYGEAAAAAAEAATLQVKAITIAPRAADEVMGLLPDSLLDQACRGLGSLLSAFRLERVNDDLHWVRPGFPPGEPFGVKLVAGDPAKPADEVSVRFVLRDTGQVLGQATTDEAGVARWTMDSALPPEPCSGVILAQVDVETAGLSIRTAALTVPQVEFDYVLRSKANTTLVLYLQERTEGGRSLAAPVASALEEALAAEGFRLASREHVLKYVGATELPADLVDEAVLSAFAPLRTALGPGRCPLIVLGEFRPHVAETSQVQDGDLYFALCPWRLRALDLELPADRQTVLDVSDTAAAAYLGDRGEALKRARAEAQAQATARLLSELRARLGQD